MMTKPLWITYAWLDNDKGDFDYLVNQLSDGGISARYDKIALIPGRRLWEQIADQITKGDLGGWAYLLTPRSVASQACREELAYALVRALSAQGEDFPLIGLLHQMPMDEVPAALRIRLCVDLRSPDWIEEVRAGLENRPPSRTVPESTPFKVKFHNSYLGNPNRLAVEFAPRLGEFRKWLIAHPSAGPEAVAYGIGQAGGGRLVGIYHNEVHETLTINGVPMKAFGCADALTPATSAYIVFKDELPSRLAYGWASEPFGPPSSWSWRSIEIARPSR